MEEQETLPETITTPPTSGSELAPTSVAEPPVEIRDPSFPIHSYMLRTRPITNPRGSEGPRGLPSRVGSMQDLPTRLESSGDAILDVQYPQLSAVEEMAGPHLPFCPLARWLTLVELTVSTRRRPS